MKPAAILLLLVAGCQGDNVLVDINCVTTAAPSVECTLNETQGKTTVDVCWDFSAMCGNGAVVKAARTCQKVPGDGSAVKAVIPADKLTGIDTCGPPNPPKAKVENLTIDGKDVEFNRTK